VGELIPVQSDSRPRAALLRVIDEARTIFAAIDELVTEIENLRGLVASLQRERDELRERCAQLSGECQREIERRTQVQEESAALFAEVRSLIANAKQKWATLEGSGLLPNSQSSHLP
jgi:predicted RNase H-like nuclease (RuvC/YqgF family)